MRTAVLLGRDLLHVVPLPCSSHHRLAAENLFLRGEPYRFVIHDRDTVFPPAVDDVLRPISLRVLLIPPRVPEANALCERPIGTARRASLEHVIPLNQRHVRKILGEWVTRCNRGRPHVSLGPGIPDVLVVTVSRAAGQATPDGQLVAMRPILAEPSSRILPRAARRPISWGVQPR